jgi:SAM-dependent methyltransferase
MTHASALQLEPPPGERTVPAFRGGWEAAGGSVEPFLSYVDGDGDQDVNWSAELEALHLESSNSHFIDVWTRSAMLARLGPIAPGAVVVDLGCSSGHLLADLRAAHPAAILVGLDLVAAGLRRAHASVPDARLVRADACRLPLAEASVDAAVSANLLEHVGDDGRALGEIARVLRPGARAVLVVPTGPGLYDYYDRFLGHQRRYARGELAARARTAGLEVLEDGYLGSLLYPAFSLVKRRNRRRRDHLRGAELGARVAADIAATRDSRAGRLAWRAEDALGRRGVRLPFGIRGLTVVRRPPAAP